MENIRKKRPLVTTKIVQYFNVTYKTIDKVIFATFYTKEKHKFSYKNIKLLVKGKTHY